ncbi:MAG: hypothetical protein IH594_12025, partial [Bacteroidales bacterium]|nr:hypothetical protein [Bacteroidales bacterium]
ISVATVSLFKVKEISEDLSYFKKTIINYIKLIVIVEFVLGYYSFSLPVEFFFILPTSMIIGALVGRSNSKKGLSKIANILIFIFGLLIIIHTAWNLINSFSEFAKFETFVELYLPPLLTILFFPFLYFMVLYSTYENGYLRLKILVKDQKISKYSKIISLIFFNFRIQLFQRWLQYLIYFKPNSKEEVNESIKKIYEMVKNENNPTPVPSNLGWCPHEAKDFLKNHGFKNSPYHPTLDEWFSGSNYVEIGGGLFKNNVAYYVEGNSCAATTLKLILNMNNTEEENEALKNFVKFGKELYHKAVKSEFLEELQLAILKGNDLKIKNENKEICVSKNIWDGARNNGYSMRLVIENIT